MAGHERSDQGQNNEPSSLYNLLCERSFETVNPLVSIYRRHGKEDKAAEIMESLSDRALPEKSKDAA
jgi:hypothetical protein